LAMEGQLIDFMKEIEITTIEAGIKEGSSRGDKKDGKL